MRASGGHTRVLDEFGRGEAAAFEFSIKDRDGLPVDVSSYAVVFRLGRRVDEPAELVITGEIVDPPSLGRVDVLVTPSQTASMEAGIWCAELWLESDGDAQMSAFSIRVYETLKVHP